jgi:nicotinamidase-related amidase
MEVIAGKTVLTTLEEIAHPTRAALLVIDVQNEFCGPTSVWRRDPDDGIERMLGNVSRLLRQARAAGLRVIYVQMITLPGLASWSPAYTRFMILKNGVPLERAGPLPGSWEAEIVAEVAPEPGETIIQKRCSSAFVDTDLERVLHEAGIESVIVCGIATHACVESTIRDAFNRDFYVVEVEDCVIAAQGDSVLPISRRNGLAAVTGVGFSLNPGQGG